MTVVVALLAELLHCALVLAAAPLAIGLRRWTEALLGRRRGPDPWQPWRDLRRLLRKRPVLAENASPLFRAAPIACFAATALAAALVPSFTLGMAFARLSDLLVLGGLLALARGVLALAALDAGTAPAGLAAARAASLACLAEPGIFLVILALGLLGGTTNLDLLIGLQVQGMLQPVAAVALTAAALATLALAGPGPTGQTAEFSGYDLALVDLAEALRQLVWLDLLAGLFLPLGMAEPGDGILGWTVGLLAWGAKLLVLTAILATLRCATGDLASARKPQALGIAAILGLLAALLVLASAVTA